jgi:rubrerythrin/predicted phosphodiesterase
MLYSISMEQQKNIIKPKEQVITYSKIKSINIIGDPGCDGLGAGIMNTFAKALDAPDSDLTLIAGDMVPHGSRQIYKNVCDFVNATARHPVYCLKGNHDTDFYDEFFGLPNYAVISEEILLIVLDNASRNFTPRALDFCRETLGVYGKEAKNIVFAFHYPPPNPIASNSINPPEWEKFKFLYRPYKDRVRYFIAGHVHTLAITSCDGIPTLVTGGGGARIEPINPEQQKSERHHRIRLFINEEATLSHEIIFLDDKVYQKELSDPVLVEKLEAALNNEIKAHFKYGLMAFKAREEGRVELAKLFTALAESEFFHAANHHEVLNKSKPLFDEISGSIDAETYEVNTMYPQFAAYAAEKEHSLARYTFVDAHNAEKIHRGLLEKALTALETERDIPKKSYYICTSCGYTFEFDDPAHKAPGRCPVCGAPEDKILPSPAC